MAEDSIEEPNYCFDGYLGKPSGNPSSGSSPNCLGRWRSRWSYVRCSQSEAPQLDFSRTVEGMPTSARPKCVSLLLLCFASGDDGFQYPDDHRVAQELQHPEKRRGGFAAADDGTVSGSTSLRGGGERRERERSHGGAQLRHDAYLPVAAASRHAGTAILLLNADMAHIELT